MQIQFHLSYYVYVTQTSQSVLSHNEFGLGRYSLIQDEEEDKEGVSIPCRLSRSTKQQFWILYNTWKLKKKNQKLLTKSNHNMNESDPRSDMHYLGSSENKAWKKFRPVRDLSLSAVQIYDFHMFLTIFQSLHGFI